MNSELTMKPVSIVLLRASLKKLIIHGIFLLEFSILRRLREILSDVLNIKQSYDRQKMFVFIFIFGFEKLFCKIQKKSNQEKRKEIVGENFQIIVHFDCLMSAAF